jgi:uncharacterized repeat protein (TIGR03803 family)
MTRRKTVAPSLFFCVLSVLVLVAPLPAASTYKVLYTFGALPDGNVPSGGTGLVLDSAGNLYGTTLEGGTGPGCGTDSGCGTLFKLTPKPDGSWTESILFEFLGDSATGACPGGLTFDAAGNLYGTTGTGGPCDDLGCGTVFKMTPNPDGSWTHSTLFDFPGLTDGTFPTYGLTFDAAGNIYGSTSEGGTQNCGTIYQLSPDPDGSWTHTVLYNFTCNSSIDGSFPEGGLVLGSSGQLFGTSLRGGNSTSCSEISCGRVFVLAKNASGEWVYHTLYSFTGGADGGSPETGLVLHTGKLYGTTRSGGNLSCASGGCGVLFELSNSNGVWTEQVLRTFEGGADGAYPVATPVFDATGRLYSASQQISGGPGYGAVLTGQAVLHHFVGRLDGEYPNSLTVDSSGNIFGTTQGGGLVPCGVNPSFGCGVVFEITQE